MKCTLLLALLLLPLGLTAATTEQAPATWWGLWHTSANISPTGIQVTDNVNLHTRLTAQNSPLLVGASVSGMRFWLPDKTPIASAQVWLSASYPTNGTMPTVMAQELTADQLLDMMHDGRPTEILFSQSYDILPPGNPYANILAGLTLRLKNGQSMMLPVSDESAPGGSYYYNGTDMSGQYGALPLQVLCSGPLIPTHAAKPLPLSEQTLQASTEATVDMKVELWSSTPVSSIDYVVTIDGQQQPTRHYNLPTAADELGLAFTLPVVFSMPSTASEHLMQVEVTAVNDVANEQENATAEGLLRTLSRLCAKRTVMEEFTGSWCHNCVRGIAGIQLLHQQHGDRFIAIAVHSTDPMQVDDYRLSTFYRNKMSILGGLPSCTIDRLIDGDPYCGFNATGTFQTDQLVAYAMNQPAVADVSVDASFADVSLTAINVCVTTSFAYDSPNAHYQLALVLLADSLTGDDKDWWQKNGYNDYTGNDPALLAFAGQGAWLKDFHFDHVAIHVEGVEQGISGSISAPLSSTEPQYYNQTIDISQNTLAQHKDRLNAVAMLIDTRNGTVVNAAQAHVAMPAGISLQPAPSAPSRAAVRYNLNGQRVERPSRGLYIEGNRLLMNIGH